MHRLVTLQVVTPKLHTVPMRTIGRDPAEILLWDAPPGTALICLNGYRHYRNIIGIQV